MNKTRLLIGAIVGVFSLEVASAMMKQLRKATGSKDPISKVATAPMLPLFP